MAEHVNRCPNCGAVVAASKFARIATCAHCGAAVHLDEAVVSVARFREAYRAWRAPSATLADAAVTVDGDAWTRLAAVAAGEISDVHLAQRQRWPGERGLLKLLRDPGDLPLFEQEWRALSHLAASPAPGAAVLARRLPQPIRFAPRPPAGMPAMVLGWAPGFEHTFADVRRRLPGGVEPRAAVWMWRRILEILAFIHRSGLVHGAVLPQHLLVERGEHGVRLVGFSCAAPPGEPLYAVCAAFEPMYPRALLDSQRLQPEHDLAMSARAIGFVLGAETDGRLPGSVPGPLADRIGEVAAGRAAGDAWSLREQLGALGRRLFGPPAFCPIDIR